MICILYATGGWLSEFDRSMAVGHSLLVLSYVYDHDGVFLLVYVNVYKHCDRHHE